MARHLNCMSFKKGREMLVHFILFLHEHLDDAKVRKVVVDEFVRFFHRNVRHYERPDLTVNFAGSIAWWFAEELKEAASIAGYKMGKIIQKPLEGLVEYHLG